MNMDAYFLLIPITQDLLKLIFLYLDFGNLQDKLLFPNDVIISFWKRYYLPAKLIGLNDKLIESTSVVINNSRVYHSFDDQPSKKYHHFSRWKIVSEWHKFGILHRENLQQEHKYPAVRIKSNLIWGNDEIYFYMDGIPLFQRYFMRCNENEKRVKRNIQMFAIKMNIDINIETEFRPEIWWPYYP